MLARQRAPEDEEVLMAMVAFLEASGVDPGGLAQNLRLLKKKRPLTEEEELLFGSALITSGKIKEAREVYEKLPLTQSTRQSGLELLSKILIAEGHEKEAAEISRRAAAQSEATPETNLQSAVTDLKSPIAEFKKQGRMQLWQLAELSTQTGLVAIVRLASNEDLTLAESRRLMDLVERHPLKTLAARLKVVSAQMRLQPDQRARLMEMEFQRFAASNIGKREEMAYWLMRENFNDKVFVLVPKDIAIQSRELYPILVQTMAQAGRWDDLQDLLKIPRPPVPASLLDLAMAEVQSHLQPDMRETRRLLQGTVTNASQGGDVETLNSAAQLAEKLDLADIACQAYEAAGLQAIEDKSSESALLNLQKSVQLALRAKDTATLLEASRHLHQLSPSSAVFTDRLVYLQLLLGVEMETVDPATLKTQNELNAAFSITLERIPPALLLALSAYRMGDPAGLQVHLAALNNVEGLSPGPRAVAAGLLSLVGKADRAFQMAEKIPDALLLDEERTFLKRAL